MSIFSKTSTQGMIKKTPGPRAPPVRSRPRRKMTARSYSCTTLMTTMRLRGREAIISKREPMVSSRE